MGQDNISSSPMNVFEYLYIYIIDYLMSLIGYEFEECILVEYFVIPSLL